MYFDSPNDEIMSDELNFVILNSTIVRNRAMAGTGGGLSSAVSLRILNSTVDSNAATETGGGIRVGLGDSNATLHLMGCFVANNSAGSGGGAVALEGRRFYASDSQFLSNYVGQDEGTRGKIGRGGALLLQNCDSHISRCTLRGNRLQGHEQAEGKEEEIKKVESGDETANTQFNYTRTAMLKNMHCLPMSHVPTYIGGAIAQYAPPPSAGT